MKNYMEKKTWEDFRNARLLWWVNRTLHLFGWAIVVELDEGTGEAVTAYPARVKYRGFDPDVEASGFAGLTSYLKIQVDELEVEAKYLPEGEGES